MVIPGGRQLTWPGIPGTRTRVQVARWIPVVATRNHAWSEAGAVHGPYRQRPTMHAGSLSCLFVGSGWPDRRVAEYTVRMPPTTLPCRAAQQLSRSGPFGATALAAVKQILVRGTPGRKAG